jgi:25S rRNA (cytosine2870-C5)-methyltransferase
VKSCLVSFVFFLWSQKENESCSTGPVSSSFNLSATKQLKAAKMGPGRRMKKQGPPQTLEQLNLSIKRKASEQSKQSGSGAKRRKSDTSNGISTKTKKSSADLRIQKSVKPPKPAVKPVPTEQTSEEEDSGDDFTVEHLGDIEDGDIADEVSDISGEEDDDADDSAFDSELDDAVPARFSEDEDESDAEERLTAANIEGLSRKLDRKQAEVDAQAQEELQDAAMQTNIVSGAGEETGDASKQGLAPDLQLLRTRITDTLRILGDFSKLADQSKSRAEYTSLLLSDICIYYGYTPYLAEKLLSLFNPLEAFAFFEANESPRPVVLRTNTLRTNRRTLAQALINRGVVLEPVGKWSKVGLQVFESAVPLGATPEYLAGHYIIQAASSFLPVMALAPQPHERILDMAAAPGGKTTHISALMRNTGTIFANDANRQRAKGLIGNIHRLGCKNTIVSNLDAKEAFPKILGGFDRVLLDAPCSGTGVIGKDPNVKTSKTERDFLALPHMQKQLLLAAIDSTDHASKTGGYIVYATCSVTVEENEGVVQYALRKRPNVRIVDTGLGTFGSEGFKKYMNKRFDERMNMTRRYFPHRENVDGFFVCKLKKTGPSPSSTATSNGVAGTSKLTPKMGSSSNGTKEMTPEAAADVTFGGFDSEEDKKYMVNAARNRLRKKGMNPKLASNKQTALGRDKADEE